MRLIVLQFLLVSLLLMSCSNSTDSAESTREHLAFVADSLEGMMRVVLDEKKAILGTSETRAKKNERPEMTVILDYPFSIGRSEVPCSEFNSKMDSLTGLSLKCNAKNLPATDLTFYDAVLFANARSKEEGLDTAYTYTKVILDAENHCVNLEGFVFHPEIEGYRLPTEAEWVLVASQNWNLENSWTADNSDYMLHAVCLKAESDEICDIAGNAMEWVNDWLGNFRDTTVLNYVGAPDGGGLGQRVVKGGSYRHASSTINLYSRGDVYAVTSSTRAEYVGFRLAFGKIPNALWMNASGNSVTNRIVPLAGASMLQSLTESSRMKLVFRNDLTGNLVYIDYSSGILSINEIADTIQVYHPDLSPDGALVAFCTGLEGVSGQSDLYVRDLNAEGTNLVKLEVESAAIPRWRVLENGDTVIVYVTDASNNKDESTFKSASTWQVKFSNGKFGKPRKLLDGSYHGGVNDHLAVTGARLLRVNVSGRDTLWYNGEQACNVSLAKDSSSRILFLDFGGKTGQGFVGEKYGVHERLLIADASGRLVQSIAAPTGYSFDHSEWLLGHSNLVVATLTNANGAHTKVVLVNVSDGTIVDLVEGDELWHPCFWVNGGASQGDGETLDLDSAGVYFAYREENHLMSSSVELAMKLQMFWKDPDVPECFVLGSSMLMDAVIEDSVKSCKMLNMGVTLADVHLFDYLVDHYIIPYATKKKTLVIELAPGLLFRSPMDYLVFLRNYSPGLIYDENHLNAENYALVARISQDYSYPRNLFTQGYMEGTFLLESVSWGDTYVSVDISQMPFDSPTLQANIDILKRMKEKAEKQGVDLVLAITPRNPAYYKDTDSFGLFGPSLEVAEKIIEELQKNGFYIFDENKNGQHDYTPEEAYNNSHLSYLGAARFTARLDSVLKVLK